MPELTRAELVEEFFRTLFPDDFQLALPVKKHKARHILHAARRRVQTLHTELRQLTRLGAGQRKSGQGSTNRDRSDAGFTALSALPSRMRGMKASISSVVGSP